MYDEVKACGAAHCEMLRNAARASLVWVRMIREYLERTGVEIGFKPAGGISCFGSGRRAC